MPHTSKQKSGLCKICTGRIIDRNALCVLVLVRVRVGLHEHTLDAAAVHGEDRDGEVFVPEAVAHLRERAEALERPAADGGAVGVVEGVLVPVEQLEKVRERHGAVELIAAVGPRDDLVFHHVLLVPDVADKLLEHVLHRDDAERAAVFVRDDGEVLLLAAELCQHVGQARGLVDEARRNELRAQIVRPAVHHGLEKAVEVQETDDIVHAAGVDRQAGIRRIVDDAHDLVPVVVDVDGDHVDAGGHGLARADVGKVERGAQQLAAVLVEHVLVLGRLDDRLQLLRGGLLGIAVAGIAVQRARDEVHEPDDEPDHGVEDDRQRADDIGIAQGDAVGVLLGDDLRHRLAEDDDQQRQHDGGHPRPLLAREQDDDHGAERRRRDVDEVVADEDGAEGAVEMVEDADGRFRAAVAVLGGVFEPQAVGRRIRHFRRGEERRQRDQHDERGKIPHDAHAGSPPFSGTASAGAASSVSSGSRRTTSLTMRFCFMSEMRTSSR